MRLVVVGGGTATNAIAPVFSDLAFHISYVVPISDNGGSTSEILRLFGGPAIGDARSRLVRLMQPSAVRDLMALRLPENSASAAHEWNLIVDGSHPIWEDIPPFMKAMYRAYLIHLHASLLKRTNSRPFNFSSASVGNLLLSGARLFFQSFEAAIEFVSHTTRVPSKYAVLPCVNSNFTHHIAAELMDGSVIVGQSEISHPSLGLGGDNELYPDSEDAAMPFAHPSLVASQIAFEKTDAIPLPSAIRRVFYINPFANEIRPTASPRVIAALSEADAVVLSVGSLYTSIIPVLVLHDFAKAMPYKCVLILNGSEDRETAGMAAVDFVDAINAACAYSVGTDTKDIVTDVIVPDTMDISELTRLRQRNLRCFSARCPNGEYMLESLSAALHQCLPEKGGIVPLDSFT